LTPVAERAGVSVVTGGAGAMGSAAALALAPAVDALLLTDVDPDRLGAVAARIERESRAKVCALAGDLADPDFVLELAGRVAALGDLRALVHTAGLSPSMAGWREILRVDLAAVARLLDAFLPQVSAGSAAVCLASVSGHMGAFDPAMDVVLDDPLAPDLEARFQALAGDAPDPGATYRLAKRGVIRLCERAAVAWGERGGRVVSLSPGLVDTAMGRLELEHNPIKVQLAGMTPVGGDRGGETILPGRTDDIANTIEFLCSERAAFVSGCDVRVDGGLIAAMNSRA
jgi:NAD(P)-dependent dehydrogenase (short-subunit alcohol dehydrogenase family)